MGLFLIDLITQSGGTHFRNSNTKNNPVIDPYLKADLANARKLTQKKARPFDAPYNEGDFSFEKSCAFLLDVLSKDKMTKLASEFCINEPKPDFEIIAKASAAYLGYFFNYGESRMPAAISLNSLYFDAIRNPSAFCGDQATPEEIQLIIEAKNKCPLCKGKKERLYHYLSGRPVSNYEVVDIFDSPSAEDDDPRIGVYSAGDWKPKLGTDENKIVLCPSHANLYKSTKDVGMCQEMYAAKRQFHIEKDKIESSERHELGEKILEILDMLLKSKRNAKENLFTGTLTIDEKMAGCDNFLIEDVTLKVTKYFNDIQDYLGDWEKKGDLDSSILAQDIKSLSKEMCLRGLPKEEIIRGITDAIDERTGHKSRSACYVITCFFVQHCEVLSE